MFRYASFLPLMALGTLISRLEAAPELSAPVARVHLISLEHRQTSSIPEVPPQCKTVCDPVNTALSSGCPATTCCQPSFEMGYFNCFQCAENSINQTDFTIAQQTLDMLVDECAADGFSLPKLTFPGQNPNRTLSSVAAPTLPASQTPTLSQTTVSTGTPTTPLSQVTVSVPPPTDASSPSPAPTTASAIKSVENSRLGFGVATLLLGACFYLGL